jgi:toxin ParE1/3/4
MNFEVVFSSKADRQLEKLQEYLAKRFYPANAERYVQRLAQACRSLANAPYRGTMRDDLSPGLRTVGFERTATIYFAVVGEQVVIVSIGYSGRGFQ